MICKNQHPACKIYEATGSCLTNFMGETKRNVETRWNEHENQNKVFEPAKHLRDFPNRKFNWEILPMAPTSRKYVRSWNHLWQPLKDLV